MHCTECPNPVRSLGLCEAHYSRHRRARNTTRRTEERLDEVEHLIAGGVWPPLAVQRCAWTITGAEKAARMSGRTRLSERLQKHASEARHRNRSAAA